MAIFLLDFTPGFIWMWHSISGQLLIIPTINAIFIMFNILWWFYFRLTYLMHTFHLLVLGKSLTNTPFKVFTIYGEQPTRQICIWTVLIFADDVFILPIKNRTIVLSNSSMMLRNMYFCKTILFISWKLLPIVIAIWLYIMKILNSTRRETEN